jgi:2',3'-cyclic-nucleotide 2'-phosphodiesterase
MSVTLLCVGDVVGRPGRHLLSSLLPDLVREHQIDCVIVNAENTAEGSGLTQPLFHKLTEYGVDLISMGDHIFRKLDILSPLENSGRIARPVNLPREAPGPDYVIHETRQGYRVALVSVLGRLFMSTQTDCPYHAVDRVLSQIPKDVKIIVVDMHAEATSEKIAMGWHLDGRVSLLFGTHTHVPTADECILPRGTAYITDVGMTGPYDSILGRRKDRVLRALITSMPNPFDVAVGDPRLCGILVKVSPVDGRAVSIERIRVNGVQTQPTPQFDPGQASQTS